MPTAFDEDGWTPELEAELIDAFSVVQIETDEIARFAAWLDSTPDAER